MLIKDNCNYGTLELANPLKIFLGMRDFHLKKPAKFTEHNSKRTQAISSSLEVVVLMRSKSLMETICLSHALKSKT